MIGHVNERSTSTHDAPDARVTISGEVTPGEWDAFVDAHRDGTADHLWRWREVFDDVFGHQSSYLVARRRDSLVGVLPLVRFQSRLFGRCLISVPFLNYGGVLASDSEAAQLYFMGISPRYVQSLREAGLKKLTARDVVRLHSMGITASLVKELQRMQQ